MSKLKTFFNADENIAYPKLTCTVSIIGKKPENKPYVGISMYEDESQIGYVWLKDKDLERFAVNILKALNSKHLSK